MSPNALKSLSFAKYERILPRMFSGAAEYRLEDMQGNTYWSQCVPDIDADENVVAAWAEMPQGLFRRQLPDGRTQFRAPISARGVGQLGWFIVGYDTQSAVPLETATDVLRSALLDAVALLQDEIELQSECNQLAVELTERYEELNLVYSTKDQVEYFEEGQEALAHLVHNCADYLDVSLAALICRDRNLTLHSGNVGDSALDVDQLIELLSTTVYDYVESQVQYVVINEVEENDRRKLFHGRTENLLAFPVLDNHGTSIGMLAVVAQRERHTFSNGDRNLLEVMAKKASRIIHTHHDSLTGLVNRSGFEAALVSVLSAAKNKAMQHCLMHVDIDQLHVINDLMGYQEGDALIKRVAKTLQMTLRESDLLARLGGDEFGVLLMNCSVARGHTIAEKIRDSIRALSVVAANKQLNVSASVGIASLSRETESIANVMASTEIACKSAKDNGRDRIEVFEEDNTTLIRRSEEMEWIGKIQEGLREDRFALYCQPIVPVRNESPPHFEILVRLRDDNDEILAPGVFLPAAERYQLMPLIDRWVIRNTLKVLKENWDSVCQSGAVFSMNLSGQSLTNVGFLAFVADAIADSTVPPENLCFEITETAAISNIDEAIDLMRSLQSRGCQFALDDFGAGLSSFGYLKMLPVNSLKIDGSFIRGIRTDEVSKSMVEAICQIGKTMQLTMVAEFVDSQETIALLKSAGVEYMQGHFVGKPEPIAHTLRDLASECDAALA